MHFLILSTFLGGVLTTPLPIDSLLDTELQEFYVQKQLIEEQQALNLLSPEAIDYLTKQREFKAMLQTLTTIAESNSSAPNTLPVQQLITDFKRYAANVSNMAKRQVQEYQQLKLSSKRQLRQLSQDLSLAAQLELKKRQKKH